MSSFIISILKVRLIVFKSDIGDNVIIKLLATYRKKNSNIHFLWYFFEVRFCVLD